MELAIECKKAEGLSHGKPLGFVQAIYKKRYNRLLLDGRQLSSYLTISVLIPKSVEISEQLLPVI